MFCLKNKSKMEYEKIKNWLKDNGYQNSGLRTDSNHRIDLYLSDVLYHYSKVTFQQLESRIKELEQTIENNTTELIKRSGDITHDYWYYCQECLHNFEIDEEFNFCPNCGRRIVR